MYHLKQILQYFRNTPDRSLNTIRIEKQKIIDNLTYLQSLHPEDALFPVLKSNAYGHGLKQVASILKHTGVDYICVDSFPEYQIVKDYAKKKVLILGETVPENYSHYDPRRATLAIYNIETLQELIASWKQWKIHLFLNTGMNREGIQKGQLNAFLELLTKSKHITLEWVMSHFANADEVDSNFNNTQIQCFKTMYTSIEQQFPHVRYRHICNSAWIAKINDPFFNAHRTGLALYGYSPLSKDDAHCSIFDALQPALSITSTITAINTLHPWDMVSYSGKRSAKETTTTATIPFGYYEWLSRSLCNQWQVERQGHYLAMIGNICMNLSCLHTEDNAIVIGDQITVISSNIDSPNTIASFAKKTNTIPYEILVKLNEKVRRIIV